MVLVFCSWISFVLATFLWDTAYALKITALYVPGGASDEAHMDCKYDLEGEPLYDVKWYKDDMQFFRCLANGSVHEFPVEGVSIYYSNYASVGSCSINLTRLTSSSGGVYKCEVSLDAPTFRTASEKRHFKVVQFSKRTQDLNDTSTGKIRSSFRNQASSSSIDLRGIGAIRHVYLVIFAFRFCGF